MILRNVICFPELPQMPVDITIRGGLIADISPSQHTHIRGDFDASPYWLMPGFVNAHTHVAMSEMRSLFPQKPNPIHRWMMPLESHLTETDVYHFARLGIAECLLGGSTTIFDHYYYPSAIAKAAEELGIRAAIAPTIVGRGGPFSKKAMLEEADRFFGQSPSPRIYPMVGPHATNTLHPRDLMQLIAQAKRQHLPIHIHVAQTHPEYKTVKRQSRCSPVQLLARLGCFDQPTLVAHAIYLDPKDVDLLSHPNVVVAVCPHSLVMYDKLSPILTFVTKNLTLGLGTDCAACNDTMDVGKEARAFITLLRAMQHQAPPKICPNPIDVLRALQQTPLRILKQKQLTGTIAVGSAADFLFIRKDAMNLYPIFDPAWSFAMNLVPENIPHVMVAGKWVVKNRKLVRASHTEILTAFHHHVQALLKRARLPDRMWHPPAFAGKQGNP